LASFLTCLLFVFRTGENTGCQSSDSSADWMACVIAPAMDTKWIIVFYARSITQQRYVHTDANPH